MKKVFITMTAIGLLLAGCSKEDNGDKVIPIQPELKVAVSNASLPDFRSGDAIGFYMYNGEKAVCENVKYTVGSTSLLKTDTTVYFPTKKNAEVSFFAYYPYNAAGNMQQKVTLPVKQYEDFDAADYDYKVATLENVTATQETVTVTFDHLFSQAKFDIQFTNKLVDLTEADKAALLESAFAAIGVKNVGTVDFKAKTATPSGSRTTVACDNDAVALVYPQTIAKGANLGVIGFTENGVDKTVTIVADKDIVFEANKQVKVTAVVGAEANVSVKVEVLPWEEVSTTTADQTIGLTDDAVIDLSAFGTANCYVVNAPNQWYKFNATVEGNGKATVGITPVKLNPSKARILWGVVEPFTTNGGFSDGADWSLSRSIIKESVSLKDGYVYFKTPGHIVPGNVVICVTDDSNNVLWSWHMWCVEGYNPEDNAQYVSNNEYYVSERVVLMDRNLGAYRNAASLANPTDEDYACTQGVAYQWGRKDPFPTSRRVNGYNYAFVYTLADGTIVSGTDAKPITEGYGTSYNYPLAIANNKITTSGTLNMYDAVAYTIAHPNVYITGNGTSGYSWTNVPTVNNDIDQGQGYGWNILWGNEKAGDFASAHEGAKSIYDPCPVGWRVGAPMAYKFFTAHNDNISPTYSKQTPWKINIANLSGLFLYDEPSHSYTTYTTRDARNGFVNAPYGVNVYIHGVRTPDPDVATNYNGFGIEPADKATAYFPAQGHLAYNNGAPSNSAGNKRMMILENTAAYYSYAARAYILQSGNAYFCGPGEFEQQACGMPVRCIKE